VVGLEQALALCGFEPGERFAVAAILNGDIRPDVFDTVAAAEAFLSGWDGWNHYITGNAIAEGVRGRPGAADVTRRRVLLVDCDPEKTPDDPAGVSARGRAAAAAVARAIFDLCGGALINSGRGHQAWLRVGAGDDPERILGGLRARFETDGVKIDGTHDASRLMRLPGSINHRTGDGVVVVATAPAVDLSTLRLPEPPPKTSRPVGVCCFDPPTAGDLAALAGALGAIWDTPTPARRSERDARFVLQGLRDGLELSALSRLLWALPGGKANEDRRGERYWVATLRWAHAQLDTEDRQREVVAAIAEPEDAFSPAALSALSWLKDTDTVGWIRTRARLKKIKGLSVGELTDALKATEQDQARATAQPDTRIRYVKKGGSGVGWLLLDEDEWLTLPKSEITTWLSGHGLDVPGEMTRALERSLELVAVPFADEYPARREWNRGGAAFAFEPVEGSHPTWDQVLRVVGSGLDHGVAGDSWCATHGICSGAQYLLTWIAAVFQCPEEPSAYLFMFGPERTGKSTLWEGLKRLLTRGLVMGKQALVSEGGFNGELAGAVLAVVDDFKLPATGGRVHNRLKEWVTAEWLSIHRKGHQPYDERSFLHFIHCANASDHCPVLDGDTRITMWVVGPCGSGDVIPKRELLARLTEEGPAFLHTVRGLELPPATERLRVPALMTVAKSKAQTANADGLSKWLRKCPGWVLMSDSDLEDSFSKSEFSHEGAVDHGIMTRDPQGWEDRALALELKRRAPWTGHANELGGNARSIGWALKRLAKLPALRLVALPRNTWKIS